MNYKTAVAKAKTDRFAANTAMDAATTFKVVADVKLQKIISKAHGIAEATAKSEINAHVKHNRARISVGH